jgi:GNAT superfamily N-acetyltransferase
MTAIRLARFSDLDEIEQALENGREFLYERGLPQWQDGHGPTRQMAESDIKKGEGYVLTLDDNPVGYSALVPGVDEYYTAIDGAWDESYSEYISIHRVAIKKARRGHGLSKIFMNGLIEAARELGFRDIRIDTHPGNDIMINLIQRSGFMYRGMINFPFPNGERRAYQILI